VYTTSEEPFSSSDEEQKDNILGLLQYDESSAPPPRTRSCNRCEETGRRCDRLLPRCTRCVTYDAECNTTVEVVVPCRLEEAYKRSIAKPIVLDTEILALRQQIQKRDKTIKRTNEKVNAMEEIIESKDRIIKILEEALEKLRKGR
jgi:hypothetical protein